MNKQRPRILVVDDSTFNANVLAGILQDEYDVTIAKSGEACLAYVDENPVDLIFLDVVMPGMDGYDVCRCLKNNLLTREIPVVFVSASDEVENQAKGLALGALDYLVRPPNPQLVKAKAHNYLALKKHQDMLEGFSFRDALTGIFNRRYLMEYLADKWNEAFYAQTSLAVIFADVDYFKKYNDFYGHLAGDSCLRKIALAIDSSLERSAEIAARYGGEEFVIVLPAADMPAAVAAAQRIQSCLAGLQLKHAKSEIASYVTLSMGLATLVPPAIKQEKVLIEMADMALYKAKKSGRNTYHCFDRPRLRPEKKLWL